MERLRYKLNLVTAPSVEPVTLDEVKNVLRIDGSEDDDFLTSLIVAARIEAESYTKRAFITQTWDMLIDNFPYDTTTIELPKAPLQSVVSLTTFNDSDTGNVFASSNFYVGTYSGEFAPCGTLTLRNDSVWPDAFRVKDAIQIQFIAGYGDAAGDVPSAIKMAIQEEVIYLYENRGCCDANGLNSLTARTLLNPFRILKI